MTAYAEAELPSGVSRRRVETATGLSMHCLEAGRGDGARPLVLLLHGFPELAYSWRHVLPALGDAGFWAIAPDQRGYGLTTGWTADFDDLAPFTIGALVRDTHALVAALGRDDVAAVIGHDFGSPVAGSCALMRPDVFRSVIMMSAPFVPPQPLPLGEPPPPTDADAIHRDLRALDRPRKHYQWYYSEPQAAGELLNPPQGLSDFLRAYYHMKSADWPDNKPYRLNGWTADALAQMPTYYVMDAATTMAEAVGPHMPSAATIAANSWLTNADLAIYVDAFQRSGFQGSLNWYRCRTTSANTPEMALFAGRTITVPAAFIAGDMDWGIEQTPGAREAMAAACTDWRGETLVPNAGHWVQQERPTDVIDGVLAFVTAVGGNA